MTTFRQLRFASNQRVSFRPQLEVLEGRTLPSIGGAFQAMENAFSDAGRVVADSISLQGAQIQAAMISSTGLGNLSQAQQTVGSDQQALQSAEASLSRDLSNLWQNIVNPFSNISSAPSQSSSSQSSSSQSSSSQSPTPQPSPSIVGTYTATLVPQYTDGNVNANTPQTLTLTLDADGSGSLNISPFAGTPQTVNFPAGTATYSSGPSVNLDYIARYTATPIEIGVGASLSPDGNALTGEFYAYNTATNDNADFFPATLNKQG